MTYDSRDQSQRIGAPVEFLAITITGTTYRYTTADEDQTYLAQTYASAPFARRQREAGSDPETSGTLELEIPLDHALAALLRNGDPVSGAVTVTMYARQRNDSETLTTFIGDLVLGAPDGDAFVLTCRSLEGQLSRRIPGVVLQRTCSNMLYDTLCQAVAASFHYTAGTVSAITGRVVTVSGAGTFAGADTDYFVGGVLLKGSAILGHIEAASGDDLTLLDAPVGLAVSDAVTVRAGCDRTIGTCKARFDNVRHFNGAHAMPTINPFTQTGQGFRV